jgi:maltose alpha-D-glucosyltransferase/alpha-amylase
MTELAMQWYKDSIIYEVHVRAFHDSDDDGYGDFRGLTLKLDYLRDLGVTAVWILPFYPSPLRDDGYDIAHYTSIHQQYGRMEDFKVFLQEAHNRGIRVITELVINHTSDQHPWFQRARLAPKGSSERNFYVWSDTPDKYADARIIFKDFEPSNWTWDPVARQYYWHRFFHHQPDLNYDNPAVWEAIFPVMDFWFEMGVDGMRLDAIPYLYEREGTNCENLPETHAYLKALRKHVEERFPDRMLLAEANQWPEEAVAYFGDGDECHMAFHFPVMPRLFMALHQEDRFPILDILDQTPPIPSSCQWCLFLRNHDELTLEMVTDEERDYMYQAYARDRTARINLGIRHRLAPLLKNDRRRIELMNALLFSLPGTPVVYYGDEIGMGDNIYLGDRNGVRTPMQWNSDRNAGFSRANPQRLYLPIIIDPEYHYEAVNVEAQQNNPNSLLWWMKRLIALRKQYLAFGRGSIRFLRPDNSKVLAFIREYDGERILIVANLSRFVQYVQLDLRDFVGVMPEEMFGRTLFPAITDDWYTMTLSPHAFYWFRLPVPRAVAVDVATGGKTALELLPELKCDRGVSSLFSRSHWDELEPLIPGYLQRRDFDTRGEPVVAARVRDVFSLAGREREVWFLIVQLELQSGVLETVSLPLTVAAKDDVGQLLGPVEHFGFARLSGQPEGILCFALAAPGCCRGMLMALEHGRVVSLDDQEIATIPFPPERQFANPNFDEMTLTLRHNSNTYASVQYGDSFVYKEFPRVEEGVNPNVEIGRMLTLAGFTGAAEMIGYTEYRRRGVEPATLGILYKYVPNQGTAWQHTLDHLSGYFERVAALAHEAPPPALSPPVAPEPHHDHEAAPGGWQDLIGHYLESVRIIGQRTAELHRALGSVADPAFVPEPFGKLYQRSIYQSLRTLVGRLNQRLRLEATRIPLDARPLADQLLASESDLLRRFRVVLDPALGGTRIRCHGNYHLDQLLYTGKDYVLSDFDGEVYRTIGERRLKKSPLQDVASMMRSFDYAAQGVLLGLSSVHGKTAGIIRPEDRELLGAWARAWYERVSTEFLASYLKTMADSRLLPASEERLKAFLDVLVLENGLRDIDLELTHRPEWLAVPLCGVVRMLSADSEGIRQA